VDNPIADNVDNPTVDLVSSPVIDDVDNPIADNVDNPTVDLVSNPVIDNIDSLVADNVDNAVIDVVFGADILVVTSSQSARLLGSLTTRTSMKMSCVCWVKFLQFCLATSGCVITRHVVPLVDIVVAWWLVDIVLVLVWLTRTLSLWLRYRRL